MAEKKVVKKGFFSNLFPESISQNDRRDKVDFTTEVVLDDETQKQVKKEEDFFTIEDDTKNDDKEEIKSVVITSGDGLLTNESEAKKEEIKKEDIKKETKKEEIKKDDIKKEEKKTNLFTYFQTFSPAVLKGNDNGGEKTPVKKN